MTPLYFGCWNEAGHYLFRPGGGHVPYAEENLVVLYGHCQHIDASLAPRRNRYGGQLCWAGQADGIKYHSEEYPQGQYLRHVLDNGYTAIQWWDRCQGDTRGACNSTILLKGEHTSEELLAALSQHFPHVLANLERAGVQLVEVRP